MLLNMRTEISPDQIRSFRETGFVVIEDFLSPTELDELGGAVDEAVAQMGNLKINSGPDWRDGDGFYDRVFTQRLNLWRINSTVKRYLLAEELGELLCRLADIDGIRVWHDQALIKEAFANPTAWHTDNPYWSFYSKSSLSIWIALDDVTAHNGCLYFMPKSHVQARFDSVPIGEDMAGLFRVYPEMGKGTPVAAPMKAGSASFHNGLTAHAAGANMTPRRRRAMTCAYMPEGSTFNGQKNILPDAYFETLKIGDVLQNETQNPLVFSRASCT
jgi:ectoine hydroxylase-related dioxygenase (phytanoyl-CoA dioxygenase family)